jgi:hypothetical protein
VAQETEALSSKPSPTKKKKKNPEISNNCTGLRMGTAFCQPGRYYSNGVKRKVSPMEKYMNINTDTFGETWFLLKHYPTGRIFM